MDTYFDVVVTKHTRVTDSIYSVELAAADGSELPSFDAGAHVEVRIQPGLVRPYSLCSDPAERGLYRLGILHEPESRGGSATICTKWSVGDRVSISKPRNMFHVDESATHSVLVAAGIGVTPLLSMAHTLARLQKSFEFHYCARDESRAAFVDELERVCEAGELKLHYSALRRFDLGRDVHAPTRSTHLYVCGPERFMKQVLDDAAALGWTDAQIHYEHFDVETDTEGDAFVIELRNGDTIEVPSGVSAAKLLVEKGYEIEMSCEKGICGSCLTGVLEGTPDHRDHYLTEEERQRGDCMTLCCSRAKTRRIKVDL